MNRINNIIDKFDALVAKNNTAAIRQFKALFGLEVLTDHRDFASAIVDPIGNPGFYLSNTWQELNWNSTYGSRNFFDFCDNITDIDPPKEIYDVDYSMSAHTHGEPWLGLGGYAVSVVFCHHSTSSHLLIAICLMSVYQNYIKTYTLPLCRSGNYNSHDCWVSSLPTLKYLVMVHF